MKQIPQIQKYMTTTPHTIGSDQALEKAKELMADLHVRHLPVLEDGKIVGVISDRDLSLISSFRDVDLKKTLVKDAMTTQPYTVSPEALLDEVVEEMAEKKYGSAIVLDGGKVVGIFTAVDGLSALAELLKTRLAK